MISYLCFVSVLFLSFRAALGATRPGILVNTLQSQFYDEAKGLWKVPAGWWNSANALEAVVEYMMYTHDESYLTVVQNTFQHTTLIETKNGYFDDAQWWGIAWTRSYELTKKVEYLQRASEIWDYVFTAWDDKCGGGLWWNSNRNYKNAITNELFSVFCTLLYKNTNNQTYLDFANKEWQWFEKSGMINSHNLINDGLDSNCNNNNQQTWTYNQGVILGGLANLYSINKNETLLEIGKKIATAAMTTLVYSGILKEPCEPYCGLDGPQFKGVFTRYLGILASALPTSQRSSFLAFLTKNTNSIWDNDRSSTNGCGLVWVGPATQAVTATTQTSALDAFNALFLLSPN